MPGIDNVQNLQAANGMAENLTVAINNLRGVMGGVVAGDVSEDVTNQSQSVDALNMQIVQLTQLDESVNNSSVAMEDLKQQVKILVTTMVSARDANLQATISAPQQSQQSAPPIAASGTFNLKKQSQFPPVPQPIQPPVPQQEGIPLQNEEPIEEFKFMDSAELRDWMEQQVDSEFVREKLLNEADNEKSDLIADAIKRFFETIVEEEKLDYAEEIWDNMPNSIKIESPQVQEGVMETNYVPREKAAETVQEANDSIKKLAQEDAKKAKTYNLHKSAQAKSMENVILFGPGQTYVDPFTRQPASEWSLIERNKGFGLVVDDVWNIDWERVWRQNVMDKYSRPYRDGDGNWVGGYIQKRFEVDKWIPEKNNLQLKPGQLRKDYIPEERLTESRMVAQRASANCPYESADKTKPFNWKEASKKQAGLPEWIAKPLKTDEEPFHAKNKLRQEEEDEIARENAMRREKKERELGRDLSVLQGKPVRRPYRKQVGKTIFDSTESFNLKEASAKKKS